MHPIILSLDSSLRAHFSTLSIESLAASLSDLLPDALEQLKNGAGSVDLSSNHDLRGLRAGRFT
ncbi:TPA: hypothetical protein ACG4ML_000396 [Stenotrophomonas maltophilia]|uniref:hypothetical protein n=1 Tax=Stenotrophomonas sp. GD03654 TaxID=2975362 RepID=UPI002447D761|nr:hypothetical protein [Stenotrophomonas sp. GD03654]HDS1367010.1 hypothetical protein [Stenotrophomonas maltophilia]MDH2177945.1 hypothetical protein [Stenotrophomonas sp. GD03654]HDS1371814.1 hypothetical protein [Stenotrophomonas maltophilia]HDS1376410.1 hypothetical protein [Stenotrophomonas maltophilia]HDS1381264.1 hypothetical protein [Stenotrophomonas maltophilia]